ncbi:MAG: hypothetical protein QME51_01920, partial [Planctomycetota bacterium]|nr:hypothetical protein [Planctomycetota bacterium]
VADVSSDDCKIRLSGIDALHTNVITTSGVFTIKGWLDVVSPTGSDSFVIAQTNVKIRWNKSKGVNKVAIYYRVNGGSPIEIDPAYSGGGGQTFYEYNWTVPDIISQDVVIEVTDMTDPTMPEVNRAKDPSASFKVRGKIVEVKSPVTDDAWIVDKQKTISWTVTGSVSKVKIYYSPDNFATITNTITTVEVNATDAGTPYVHPNAGSGKGTYLWTVQDDIQKEVWIKVVPQAQGGLPVGFSTPATSGKFKIRGEIKVTRPNAATYWICTTQEEIKWEIIGSAITRVDVAYVEYHADNSVSETTTFAPNIVATDTVIALPKYSRTYTWTAVASDLSIYDPNTRVKIRVTDVAGNADPDESDVYFEIRPEIVIDSPKTTDNWLVGETNKPISWTWKGPASKLIKIELIKGAEPPENISAQVVPANPTGSTGIVYWTVRDRVSPNVTIRVSNIDNPNVNSPGGPFIIRGAVNNIDAPLSGVKWLIDETKNVEWTQLGTFRVIVQYSKNDFGTTYDLGEKDANDGSNTFAWLIPDNANYYGTTGKIRIVDKNNSAVSKTMAASFKVLGDLRLDQPNGGVTYVVDQDIAVGWTTISGSGVTIPFIDLHYSIDAGGTYPDPAQKIATYANPGADTKTWKIPDKIGQTVKVRVRDTTIGNDVSDPSNASFKIKGDIVEVISPSVGTDVTVGNPLTITWRCIGTFPDVKLQYSRNNKLDWVDITTISDNVSGTKTVEWNIPANELIDSSECFIRVKTLDTDWQGLSKDSGKFTIKGTVAVNTPNASSDFIVAEQNKTIAGTKSAGVNKIKLQWRKDGLGWNDITELIGLEGPTTWSYNLWTIPNAISNNVQVRALDTTDLNITIPASHTSLAFPVRGKIESVTNIATGESLVLGTYKTISWTFTGTITEVKLYYSTNNFVTTKTIETVSMVAPKVGYSHPTAGSGVHDYDWLVPDDIAPAVKVKVVPSVPGGEGLSVSNISNECKIIGQFQSVQSPLNDAVWVVDETNRIIKWRVKGKSMNNVKITYKKMDGLPEIPIVNSTPATNTVFEAPSICDGEYTWIQGVADAISSTVRILIRDVDNPSVVIQSSPFNIRGKLIVTYPNAGNEKWVANQNYPITWTCVGSIEFVKIEYSTDGSNYIQIVASYETSSGTNKTYNSPNGWTVPSNITITSQALIKLTDVSPYTSDPDLVCSDPSDNNFRIVGKLAFTSPNANYNVEDKINFQWNATGKINSVNIYYSRDNFAAITSTVQTGIASAFGPNSWEWTIPNTLPAADLNKDLRFRIWDANADETLRVYTDTANTSRIHGKFTLDYPNPVLPGGITWTVGTTKPITWTTVGLVTKVNLQYSKYDGADGTWINFGGAANIDNEPNGQKSIDITVDDTITDTFRVRVVDAQDDYASAKSGERFNVKGKIEVWKPDGTDRWQVSDSTRQIVWRITGSITAVKLEYSVGGGSPNPIIASTPATDTYIGPPVYYYEGRYTWPEVPNVPGNQVKVHISTVDGDWQNLSEPGVDFKVRAKITMLAPNGSETYYVYNNPRYTTLHPIQWRITGTLTSVKLGLSVNDIGGTYEQILITPTAGTGIYTYQWPVSDSVSSACRIKVWDNDYPSDSPEPVYGVSANNFNIKNKIELKKPDGGSEWEVTGQGEIKWESTGNIGNLIIEYKKVDGNWGEVTTTPCNAAGTYSHYWNNVADVITTTARVRIRPQTPANADTQESVDFKIKTKITVDKPALDEDYLVYNPPAQGSTYPISWTYTGTVQWVTLQYKSGGGEWTPIGTVPAGSGGKGIYPWSVPDAINGTVYVKVIDATSGHPAVEKESSKFRIKGKLIITAPDGDTWVYQESRGVTWTAVGTTGNVKVEYSVNGGASWVDPAIASSAASVSGTTNSVAWTIPDVITSTAKVRVSTIDGWQNISDEKTLKIKGLLQLTGPLSNTVLTVDQNCVIQGTKSKAVKKLKIEFGNDYDAYPNPTWRTLESEYDVYGIGDQTSWSYSGWTVDNKISPNTTTPKAQVRVTDVTNSQVPIERKAEEIKIKGELSLIAAGSSPAENVTWLVGSSQNITWTAKGTVSPVNIYYSPNGSIWVLIKSGLIEIPAGSGQKTWEWGSVRDEVSAGFIARIRVTDSRDEDVVSGTSKVFKVKGVLTVNTPPDTAGQIYRVSKVENIQWNSTAASINNVKLYYVVGGSEDPAPFATISSVKGINNYSWVVSNTKISDDVRIKVVAVVDSDVNSTSANSFKIKPELKLTSPGGTNGEVYTVNQQIAINWYCSGTQPASVRLYYDKNDNNWVELTNSPQGCGTGTNTASPQWSIPDGALGAAVRIQVRHPTDGAVSSTSTYTFKVKGDFTNIRFAGGVTEVEVSSNPEIVWDKIGPVAKVHLKYFKNNWEDIRDITPPATPTDNTGSYTGWIVQDNISTANIYKIVVIDASDGSVSNTSAVPFKIKGKFNITTPSGTPTWVVDELRTMTWTTTGDIVSVNLQYSKDGLSWLTFPGCSGIPNTPNGTSSKEVTVQDAITNTFRVRVQSQVDPTVWNATPTLFNVKGKIEVTAPTSSDRWQVSDSTRQIKWRIKGSIQSVKLDYSVGGGGLNPIIASTPATDTYIGPPVYYYEGRYTWPEVPNVPSSQVKVHISTIDGDWQTLSEPGVNFKVRAKIEVLAPNGAETYYVYNNPRYTTLHPIQWRITG